MHKKGIWGRIISLLLGFKFENGKFIMFDDTELYKDE